MNKSFLKYYFTGARTLYSVPFALFFIGYLVYAYIFGFEYGLGRFAIGLVMIIGFNIACIAQAKSTFKEVKKDEKKDGN